MNKSIEVAIGVVSILGLGVMGTGVISEISNGAEIGEISRMLPPVCPTLKGEHWRVVSLGKNVFRIEDMVELGLNARAERVRAGLNGLREVTQRFEGRVLSVTPGREQSQHIVVVTDDGCN